MSADNSTTTTTSVNRQPVRNAPVKPRPDFPLTLHKASGQYCKKIKGRIWYFGKDPAAALVKYEAERGEIEAGRNPRPQPQEDSGPLNVKDVCNRFLRAKRDALNAGELTKRTEVEYKITCRRLLDEFGARTLVTDLNVTDFSALRRKLTHA
jgi:hypothetical protein